jgi:hypothetical protein
MREFTGYNIKTVPQMGWTGIKNGQLLGLASQEFDIFITVDKNLPFEQNLPQFNLAIIMALPNLSCKTINNLCL